MQVYSGVEASGIAVFELAVPNGAAATNDSVPVVPGGWPGSQGNVKPIVAFPAFSTASADVGNGTGPGLASLTQLRWEDNFCYWSHGPALSRCACIHGLPFASSASCVDRRLPRLCTMLSLPLCCFQAQV